GREDRRGVRVRRSGGSEGGEFAEGVAAGACEVGGVEAGSAVVQVEQRFGFDALLGGGGLPRNPGVEDAGCDENRDVARAEEVELDAVFGVEALEALWGLADGVAAGIEDLDRRFEELAFVGEGDFDHSRSYTLAMGIPFSAIMK